MSLYQFDAYEAYRNLKDRYAEYLLDSFRIARGPLSRMLLGHWRSEDPASAALLAPLLVQAAFPFVPGLTAQELTSPSPRAQDPARPLHPRTFALLEKAGFRDSFYAHQVDAIRAGCAGKTVVLSAGTGSGKTEAFLVPLIDRLHWAEERGEDDLSQPGVRAIIVYPLNALVNNQVDRVRNLLASQDRITFAYYTSRLPETYGEAKGALEAKGVKKAGMPPRCQIIDRRTLRGLDPDTSRPSGPPHILITNFSMLEYMLIRAIDRTIFEPAHLFTAAKRPRLGAVVLDEAHVYGGAQAAEIHMLLRRAARRFGTTLEDLQGYATSATLSRSSKDEEGVLARFGEGMFRTPPGRLVALVGRRHLPDETGAARTATLTDPAKLPEGHLVAPELRTLEFDSNGTPSGLVVDPALGGLAADAMVTLGLATREEIAALEPALQACPSLLLHRLLSTHGRMIELRSWFYERADRDLPSLDDVATFLYGVGEASEARRRATDAVLRLASLARREPKSLPLVPTRMHAMLRAPRGVWVDPRPGGSQEGPGEDPWPWGAVDARPPSGAKEEPPRFPLCVCTTCGATALEAWEGKDDWGEVQLFPRSQGQTTPAAIFHDPGSDTRLPAALGGLPVRSVAQRRRRGGQSTIECPRCGDPEARLRTLALSPRAALGAIVDAIYPYLNEHPADGGTKPGGGRRILSFSDSRQEAARVAVEVEESHDVGLNRRMLWDAIRGYDDPVTIKELIADLSDGEMLRQRAAACDLPPALLPDLATISVYQEFARLPARGNTLETLGLIEVVYPKLPPRPAGLTALDDTTWQDFLAAVLDDARRRGIVRPPFVSPEAQANHQLEQLLPPTIDKRLVWTTSVPGEDGDEGSDVVPVLPQNRERGRLFGFASAVAQKCAGGTLDPVALLDHAWKALLVLGRTPSCRWLKAEKGEDALRIDLQGLSLRAHDAPPYIEAAARRVHFRHILGCVPERGMPGTVRPLTAEEREAWRSRHAIRRILDDQPLALWSVEHTAQLDTDELEQQEALFRAGQRNLMASSTTMEMGVDLGGLTFVLMTNVPPAPSNYWQRAGRAGRRADGSAMALTLALGRPHDQKVFADPKAFLLGPVMPPTVRLDTPPLVLRHANALLLGAFLDQVAVPTRSGAPMRAFGTVAELLFEPALAKPGFDPGVADKLGLDPNEPLSTAYVRWLEQLQETDAVAGEVHRLLEGTPLEIWTIAEVAATSAAAFERATAPALQDRDAIHEQRRAEKARGEGAADTRYLTALEIQEKDIANETVIAYLARTDYLPRFGFPISLVRLETKWRQQKRRTGDDDRPAVPELRMERSLDIALSEYAPGAEVIAGKRVHRVAGILRNWMSDDSGMVQRRVFFECRKCGAVQDRAAAPLRCPVCNHPTVEEKKFLDDARKKQKSKAQDSAPTAGELAPSPLRHYLMPSSFAVQFGRPPRRLAGDLERMPPARVVLVTSTDSPVIEVLPSAIAVGFAPESRLFVRSEGDRPFPTAPYGWGYAICQSCGRAGPEEGWRGQENTALPRALQGHWRLRGGDCTAKSYWRNSVLGTAGMVDVFRLRLLGDFAPKLQPGDEESFFTTLAICLHQVVCQRLQLDPRALKPTVGTWHVPAVGDAREMFGREAVIYDESGSGILAHVAADGSDIVREIVDFVERRTDLDLIAFDTQFVAMEGKLRLDLVRAHLLEPARRVRIAAPAIFDALGAAPLRGITIRSATRTLLGDAGAEVGLWASAIAADAFDRDAVLRAVHLRVLRGGGRPVRLLLGSAPRPASGTADEAFVAGRVRQLLGEGMEVRVVAGGGLGRLGQTPWQVLSRDLHGPRALGGGIAVDGGKRVVSPPGVSFGRAWLEGALALEATPDAAKAAWEAFDQAWASGRPLLKEELEAKPVSSVEFVPVRQGATDDKSTVPQTLLASKLGDLKKLGRVTRVAYVDRYVLRSAVAMWRLADLLRRFDYAKAARGFVLAQPVDNPYSRRSAEELLKDTRVPRDLSQHESAQMEEWCRKQSSSVGLDLAFQARGRDEGVYLRHPRKLLVEFAPGGALRTLKVLFEHGLDWVFPVAGRGPWTQRPLRAEETHIVMLRDHRLEDEMDERGQSEWVMLFGAGGS